MTDKEMLINTKKQLEHIRSLFSVLDNEHSLTVVNNEANELFDTLISLTEDIQIHLNK
jgi:hypothetical protein